MLLFARGGGRALVHRLSLRLAAVGVPSVLVLAGCGSALAASNPVSIDIVDVPRAQQDWGYAPGTREIGPGTWVTWSNAGLDAHTVTAVDGSFDSGNLDPSEGFAWYFDQPGTFEYLCALHPWMRGSVVVDEGAAPDEGQPADASDAQP